MQQQSDQSRHPLPAQGMQQNPSLQGQHLNPAMQGMQQFPAAQGMQPWPVQGIQTSPGQGMQQFPAQGVQQFPGQGMQQFPGQGMQQFPAQGMQQFPGQSMQQLPAQAMQPVMLYTQQGTNYYGRVEGYKSQQSKVYGTLQILTGILCVIFHIAALGVGPITFEVIGHGIWNGILFIITGALGVSAGSNQTKCKIISFMVLCIISAVSTMTLFSLGIIGAVIGGSYLNMYECGHDDYLYSGRNHCSWINAVVAMDSLMVILAVLEAIFAIRGSCLGCEVFCCRPTPGCTNAVMVIPQYCGSTQQVQAYGNGTQLPFQQQMLYYVCLSHGNQDNSAISQPSSSSSPIHPMVNKECKEEMNNSLQCAPDVLIPENPENGEMIYPQETDVETESFSDYRWLV